MSNIKLTKANFIADLQAYGHFVGLLLVTVGIPNAN